MLFRSWKVVSGREWAPEEVSGLIREGKAGPLSGFRSRMGRPFVATLRLTPEFKIEFDFGQERTNAAGEVEMPDLSGKEPVGSCPKCGAHVYELDMAYSCEKALGPEKSCDFRSGKVILQRPIEREQMVKLLSTGRTDLLSKFISKKGRPFQAFLVKGPDGAVRFEFAPRAAKVPKRQAAASTSGEGTDTADAASTQTSPAIPIRKTSRKKTVPDSTAKATASVKRSTRKRPGASAEKPVAKKAVSRKKKAKAAE